MVTTVLCGGVTTDEVVSVDGLDNSVVGELSCFCVAMDIVSADVVVCVVNAFSMDSAVCVGVVTDPWCVGVVL